jgi:hypothetical protein
VSLSYDSGQYCEVPTGSENVCLLNLPRWQAITLTSASAGVAVSLSTEKIKGLPVKDFVMASGCAIARIGPATSSSEKLRQGFALRFRQLAAINDASHVKRFTFLHYRLSVEQNSFASVE